MPLYDISHNPLTTDQAIGTLVDDGTSPSALYTEALSRRTANQLAALAAAQPVIPVSSGNIAFTISDFQAFSQWAARPYDSFDGLNVLNGLYSPQTVKQVMDDMASTGGGLPVSQADILLRLVWVMRVVRLSAGLSNPNPIVRPNTLNVSPWVASSITIATNGAAPDGTNTANILTCASTSHVYQPAIPLGQPIAGRQYTFRAWMRSPSKATIGMNINANSGSGDDTAQSIALTTDWAQVSVTKTFSLSGSSIDIGIDNRTGIGVGGDGISGDVYVWGATVTCES